METLGASFGINAEKLLAFTGIKDTGLHKNNISLFELIALAHVLRNNWR